MPKLSHAYTGRYASEYEQRRRTKQQWILEDRSITGAFAAIRPREVVLDLPAGTGRWLEAFKARGASVILLDVSSDMLAQAQDRAAALDFPVQVICGDAFRMTALPSADWMVSTRFLNWISVRAIHDLFDRARRAGIGKHIVSIRYVPTDSKPIHKLRAYLHCLMRNLRVVRGVGNRSRMYMHSERDIRRLLTKSGLTAERETVIEETRGIRKVVLVLKRDRPD